ncbi:MAG TPA: M23 family metallopeptidase [Saprospiraceae bacterium]|nr:M23 family metallopeptidase [Saprospiraceae bacterium]HMV22902.1 M23 family metallopeptidase [Saprospiraceae bacterium]HNE66246.1 M23 family metallopeptidase [Saprospiraceae bacterium]HNG13045.1 M23 family metallopeptidase [Saprospiraceae bacterium]HNL29897.1 M23 family metallopeptidase [Saprospiraceae bacterium]
MDNPIKLSWKQRLKENYRLVVMHNETFKEVGSYKLNLLNLYILLSSIFVALTILVFCLVMYTPIKKYIPGYGDYNQYAKVAALQDRIRKLEQEVQAQNEYTNNIKKILIGEYETAKDQDEQSVPKELVVPEPVKRIPEDEKLRKSVGKENNSQSVPSYNFTPFDVPIENNTFISPLKGIVSSEFKSIQKHYGIDVIAPKDSPIKAIKDGHVILADWTLETGFTIGIQHSNNIVTFYKHNSSLLKKIGDTVKQGESIAVIGNTGMLTDGYHLHFELWHNGAPVDPAGLMTFN